MGTILLEEYPKAVRRTDELDKNDITPVLMGLYGEVGSLMTTAKKLSREGKAYIEYRNAAHEEFGDVLWYLNALCDRFNYPLIDVFSDALDENTFNATIAANDIPEAPISRSFSLSVLPTVNNALLKLGEVTSQLLNIRGPNTDTYQKICTFIYFYIQALQVTKTPFSAVINHNIHKVQGRFLEPNYKSLPSFDHKFEEEEQIPKKFEIHIIERNNGQCYLQMNGVFIGDPLTDNINDPDGYRFHDVFHFANAAILHWSPIFRGLIKQKRKSDPATDENEDGGRAGVIEEGISALVFSRAKFLDYFEGHKRISFDLLKTIQQFSRGYEVEKCPLKLWEYNILTAYEVFRKVRDNTGGVIIGDRQSRTLEYREFK